MSDQGNASLLQRVRCSHCGFPLLQISQGDLLSPSHHNDEAAASQLPAHSYRLLTDPQPLLCCPRCDTPLSSATVTIVVTRTVVTQERTD